MNTLINNNLYNNAKRIAIIAYDKITKNIYHIFSVVELLPLDIQEYNIPKANWHVDKKHPNTYSMRSEISGNDYSFSIIVQDISKEAALNIFEYPLLNNTIDGATNSYFNKTFFREPSGKFPLLFASNIHETKGLASVIPQRKSGGSVWIQIDSERVVEKLLIRDNVDNNMKALMQLTNNWLGFNIVEKSEHLGNIYLVAPNPYYRDLDISLSSNPIGIFYRFKMRKGIKEEFKIRIIDKHGDNIALDKVFSLNNYFVFLDLPHEPQLTEVRVYNSKDDLVGIEGPFTFLKSIQFNMSIKQADFNVKVETEKGLNEFTVEKFSKEKVNVIGEKLRFNPAYYFKDAEQNRTHIDLDTHNEFIFFQGGRSEKEKTEVKTNAKKRIGQLINTSGDTCFMCDPYFNVNDLIEFGFKVKGSGIKIRILNKRGKNFVNKVKAKQLLEAINEFNSKPFEKIECRLLKENLLHDRFIISDTNVWYLGSSFSEFGERATCIGKVPKSFDREITKEIEKWFYSEEFTQSLEDYLNMEEDE
jgi:hypothetical protein